MVHVPHVQVTFRSFLLERKNQRLREGRGGGGLASQQLPTDSEDRENPRQSYESSSSSSGAGSSFPLPSGTGAGSGGDKQFVRV